MTGKKNHKEVSVERTEMKSVAEVGVGSDKRIQMENFDAAENDAEQSL